MRNFKEESAENEYRMFSIYNVIISCLKIFLHKMLFHTWHYSEAHSLHKGCHRHKQAQRNSNLCLKKTS